jgi:hypothetical protein
VRGRGVFPFISQGASLTSSSLFDIYIYIYIYIYRERERERERESHLVVVMGPLLWSCEVVLPVWCRPSHLFLWRICGRRPCDDMRRIPRFSLGTRFIQHHFLIRRGPYIVLPCAQIRLFGMMPCHVAPDIPATMESSTLRSPLTETASSHQTVRYAQIIRKGCTVMATTITWAPGDVSCCGRRMLATLVQNLGLLRWGLGRLLCLAD